MSIPAARFWPRPGSSAGTEAELTVDGEPLGGPVAVHAASPDAVDLEVDGIRRVYSVHRVTAGSSTIVYVDGPDGSASLTEVPRFAGPSAASHGGSLLAPMPGLVVRVLAEPGAAVTAGQPLVVLEAMKMEHEVAAPAGGIVTELRAAAGQQVKGRPGAGRRRELIGGLHASGHERTRRRRGGRDRRAAPACRRAGRAGLAAGHPGSRLEHRRPGQSPRALRRGRHRVGGPAARVQRRAGRRRAPPAASTRTPSPSSTGRSPRPRCSSGSTRPGPGC